MNLREIPTWAKVGAAIGIGGLLIALLSGVSIRRYLRQADGRWSTDFLGNSQSVTIGSAGCFLTALTMAANALTGSDWNPDEAQEIIKSGGGFSGAELILETAASSLNLVAPDSERIHENQGSTASMRARVDHALARGGLAIVGVDENSGAAVGKHFILVHKKTLHGYAAADSATGTDTFIDPSTMSAVAMWNGTPVNYQATGVAPAYRSA